MDIDAHDTVFRGDSFLRRASKAVESLIQHDTSEPDVREERDELCLRQSAGDSTGPEVDVASDGFRQLVGDDNVAIEELAAGL